jgi:hypothetical protein
MTDEPRYIPCASYTRGARHAGVIGEAGGWNKFPFPMTVPQTLAALGAGVGMVFTRGLWARFGIANFAIFAGVVLSVRYAARHVRLEGRAPWAVAIGAVGSLLAFGRMNGRIYRPGRPRKVTAKMLVVPDASWHYHTLGKHDGRIRFSFWHTHGDAS